MLDDHRRVDRLRKDPHREIPLGYRMQRFVEALQKRIVRAFEEIDGSARFGADRWEHREGGGGLSRVIENGTIWEKGGVNVSAVHGTLPEAIARAFEVRPKPFFATGISLVMHPRNPYVPTVHANFRYFALGKDLLEPEDQWFGGGADLTPYYGNLDDAQHFHRIWRDLCSAHTPIADYPLFKTACDRYFFLPHRKEARGVGGIFFDYIREDPEGAFHFVRQAGRAFLSSYLPIVRRNADKPFGERERTYQEIRRGRYAEFNLAYDRGTRFGLETAGRTESILMSLPPAVRWVYDWKPDAGSAEEAAQWFYQPREWLGLTSSDVVPSGKP